MRSPRALVAPEKDQKLEARSEELEEQSEARRIRIRRISFALVRF